MLIDLAAIALTAVLAAWGAVRGPVLASPFALGAGAAAAVLVFFGGLLASAFRQAFELPIEAAGVTSALAVFLAVYAAAGASLRAALVRVRGQVPRAGGLVRRVAGAAVGAAHALLLAWWLLSAAALLDRPLRGYGKLYVPSESSSLVALCRRFNLVALGGDAASQERLSRPLAGSPR